MWLSVFGQSNQEMAGANLIRLSGLVPDRDIKIEFSGIRPGEKLYEELVYAGEVAEPSGVDGILQVQPAPLPEQQTLLAQIATPERLARNDAPAAVRPTSVMGATKRVTELLLLSAVH